MLELKLVLHIPQVAVMMLWDDSLACLAWVLALGDSFLDIIPFVPTWNNNISSVTFYIGNINFSVDFIGADSEEITLILSRETLSSDL